MVKKNWKIKLGIFLIIFSTAVFLSLLIVPFLNADGKAKATITTIAIIVGEVTFWSGGILVGKELLKKYKSYFNPKNWFRKKSEKQKGR